MTTLEQLQPIFRDIFNDNSIIITQQTSANDIEDWDSFNHINLIAAIEDHFGIKFDLGDMQSLENVGDMTERIDEKIRNK